MIEEDVDALMTGTQSDAPSELYGGDQNEEVSEDDGIQSDDGIDAGLDADDAGDAPTEDKAADTEPEPKTEDEYGNEKKNESIRERLARKDRQHQAEMDAMRESLRQEYEQKARQQLAKAERDPSEEEWEEQLNKIIKKTVRSMGAEESSEKQQEQYRTEQMEFESKFRNGMDNFSDFKEVVRGLGFEITDSMTLATRGMKDPAAFIYAAAKRSPQELERISKISDSYAQITEMGRLEERMRKTSTGTKAPKPLPRTTQDTNTQITKRGEETVDDLIEASQRKMLRDLNARRRR